MQNRITTRADAKRPARDWALLSELACVLALLLGPALAWLACSTLWGDEYRKFDEGAAIADAQNPVAANASTVTSTVLALRLLPILLLVAARREGGLARFGVVRPKLGKDLAIGIGTWLVVAAWTALLGMRGGGHAAMWAICPAPIPVGRGLLLAANCLAVGLLEEFGMRAYLITSIEKLTGSSSAALAISAFVFGCAHFSKGPIGVINSFVAGAVWGAAYCATRRLWPVALSHALTNFVVKTHIATLVR